MPDGDREGSIGRRLALFQKILIANRGEIAARVVRTARRLGIATVAVFSDADAGALHVALADEAVRIGPPPARDSYLKIDAIIEAARRTGAQAIHPGYGFLSENPAFVEAIEAASLIFIGPSAAAIRAMGLKDAAKRLMEEAGVPVVPGYHGDEQDPHFLAGRAAEIGYPVLIKAAAGGGGKGMRRVDDPAGFAEALASAQGEARSAFGDDRVLVEKYVTKPRHIEVQVFGDGARALHLFERDCSLQRRHQKVIEEAPAPGMTPEMREAMGGAATRAAEAIGYSGAGTVEFIVDASRGLRPDGFWFMEMNTRLQVEHPVTEAITGVDLVEWQLRVAAGEPLPARQEDLCISGHAFEARIYAEDPAAGFLPATGRLGHLAFPPDARVDTGVRAGDAITPHYDPMIAKLVVHGPDRATALGRLGRALAGTQVAGTVTNVAFLSALAAHAGFAAGDVDTGLIDRDAAALTAAPEPTAEAWAIAAVAALDLNAAPAEPQGGDPWTTLTGWRLWGAARQTARFEHAGHLHAVAVTTYAPGRFHADTPAGTVAIVIRTARDGRTWRVEADGHRGDATAVRHKGAHGDELTVFHAGQAHAFTVPDALALAEEASHGGDRVAAPMTGLVKSVAATPGARVERGAALAVMEAMKMEHTLRAPRDGAVAEVLAAPGEQVAEGAVLVTLEPEDTDG